MKIHRNETVTGLFTLISIALFVGILVVIGIPGVFSSAKTFRIYFDNASGVRYGSAVLLAGREIGKVSNIESPIPLAKRPKGHPNYEIAIDVKVSGNAPVYRKTKVHLKQQTMMGVRVIDFWDGDEKGGLAPDGTEFVGERVPDVAETISNSVKGLFDPNSDLGMTMKNVREFSDTVKREPWRLIWKDTKEYPGDKKKEEEERKKEEAKFRKETREMKEKAAKTKSKVP